MPDSPYAGKGTQEDLAPNGEPVALSTLIEHDVRLEWHEAVAIVRDISQLLRGADPLEPVPDLRHIWICQNGRMAIAPGTAGGRAPTEHPVATLGRLLLSLVEEAQMPVQLRIVALSAASTTPAYTTVDEFSNALAYFDRPNSADPIRLVYSRWHQLAAESDALSALQPRPPAPPPPTSLPPVTEDVVDLTAPSDALGLFLPEKKVVTVRGRPFPIFSIATAAAVILVAILILAWLFSGGSRPSSGAGQPAQAPVEETASGTITESSPAAEDAKPDTVQGSAARGSGAELWQPRSGPAPAVATRNRFERAAAGPATPTARQGNQPTQSAPRAQPNPKATGLAAPPLGSASQAAAPAPASPAAASSRQPSIDERLPVPVGEPPDTFYSSSDPDVEPPILVRPKMSVDPPTGSRPEGMTVLDVLISESGRVETIKLAAPAQDFREAMMISAVKTWKFRPGMRDGHPVRYLKRIWVQTSPVGTLVR